MVPLRRVPPTAIRQQSSKKQDHRPAGECRGALHMVYSRVEPMGSQIGAKCEPELPMRVLRLISSSFTLFAVSLIISQNKSSHSKCNALERSTLGGLFASLCLESLVLLLFLFFCCVPFSIWLFYFPYMLIFSEEY